ncbi:MAG: L,D-transpeptidase family protein [Lentisphaerae bacterium]|nr:L,D-transpeptidase family protein [Lentisphaerota bacterium]OQC15491.1 MAG: putative L,D-transpeptidase YkuD [Lentisphaerae bacterium ADurb.Bin082]HQL87051.1 L,D-transpeptidase family protein [Lentisphaeria bacterium]
MYWYYKWPLIIIFLLLAVGLGSLLWRSCLPTRPAAPPDDPAPKAQTSSVATKTGDANAGASSKSVSSSRQAAAPDSSNAAVTVPPPTPVLPEAMFTFSHQDEYRLDSAERQLLADQPLAARTLAQIVMANNALIPGSKEWHRVTSIVNAANRVFMNSAAPSPEKTTYIISAGDSLSRIATSNRTTIGALIRLNELSQTNQIIHPGNAMHILTGDWSIHVIKSQFLLLLYLGPDLYRVYSVGIGRQDRTPVGTFAITSKVLNPAWTPPGKNIPYGHPENILGTRWLGISPIGSTNPSLRGFGIHGTWEQDSIGTAASAGCVRMRNEEVEELYDFIPMPSSAHTFVKVTIEE